MNAIILDGKTWSLCCEPDGTPLMYEQNLYFKLTDGSKGFLLVGGENKRETSALIVKAVNEHAALLAVVEAAKAMQEFFDNGTPVRPGSHVQQELTLALAKLSELNPAI